LIHEPVRELAESTALPRLEARARAALNRLYDERAAPLAIIVRGQAHRVRWSYEGGAMPPHDSYRFSLGGRAGRIGLDRPAQALLTAEARLDALPADLRCILLADALQQVVDALMQSTRLAFEWAPGDPDPAAEALAAPGRHAAFFRVVVAPATPATSPPTPSQTPSPTPLHPSAPTLAPTSAPTSRAATGWRGFIEFDDGAAWADLAPPLAPRTAATAAADDTLAWLRLPLRWCLGTTLLRLREVRSIEPGDLVSVEHWRAAGAAVVVTAEPAGAVGWRLVGLAEGSRITVQQSRDTAMNRNPQAPVEPTESRPAASPPIDRLDALEVTLRFEVGDLEVSLGELRSLRAGHVFDLGQPLNRSVVRILAHGNLLGTGHLVAVGEQLGVRVAEFTPGEL
jgi:type III secretion protein Q